MSGFTEAHVAQGTKGAVHGALLTLAAMCSVYNICCYKVRPARHLGVNAVLYTGLIVFEAYQVYRHGTQR